MVGRLTCGRSTVMTIRTPPSDRAVVKDCTVPAIGSVAVVTAIATGDVVGRLALRHRTVVAAGAGANHSTVVNSADRAEAISGMAILTVVAGVNMATVFACGGTAVVAARAIAGDRTVIKDRSVPAVGGVAVFTAIATGNVVG